MKLLHTLRHQAFHLSFNILHRTGAMLSGNDGDGTIRTTTVTAFRNFQISVMRRSCQRTF